MKLFLLPLLVSCATATVIDITSDREQHDEHYNEEPAVETKEIMTIPNKGTFLLKVVPYLKLVVPELFITRYVVKLIWVSQVTTGEEQMLDMLNVNWPENSHKVDDIKDFIIPMEVNVKQGITVKYIRASGPVKKSYPYNYIHKLYARDGILEPC